MLFQRTPQEDLEAGADLLYELVDTAYLEEKAIPNEIELVKKARLNFEIGIKESKDCVRLMEQKYKKGLYETGYFDGLPKGICWHGDIHDTGF